MADITTELKNLIESECKIVWLVSREEKRMLEVIRQVTEKLKIRYGLTTWDIADEARELIPGQPGFNAKQRSSLDMADAIQNYKGNMIFVLKDFHLHLKGGEVALATVRRLRNFANAVESTPFRKTILILSPVRTMPEELRDDVYVLDVPLPTFKELMKLFTDATSKSRELIRMNDTELQRLIESALGLTSNQFSRVLARILMTFGVIDYRSIDFLLTEKQQIIKESGALEFFPVTQTTNSVGGLAGLIDWLKKREIGFTKRGRDEFRLPLPKGVALIGIPGTGKSLSAKVIANMWQMPLLRMDMGAIFGSLVGQSEENIRTAIKLAEAVSPCVLWIDEVEKGFAGVGGGGDSGTAARVFGHFLTWMQEKTKPVYIVTTANDVSRIPLEFLRKGRFDEVFFLDIPTQCEREQIFTVHLTKYIGVTFGFDVEGLAASKENLVGAEIEHAVIEAMYRAANDNGRQPTQDDILATLNEIKPLFEIQKEETEYIRGWAKRVQARPASLETNHYSTDGNRRLSL